MPPAATIRRHPGGRPPKDPAKKMGASLQIPLTADQREGVDRLAARNGHATAASYVRQWLLLELRKHGMSKD